VWETKNAYRFLVLKSEGKRPLERPRRRWEENIKMDLEEAVRGLWSKCISLRNG
jgi:hypothetical protein